MTAPAPQAPIREIGVSNPTSWWNDLSQEETPELKFPESIKVYNRMRKDPQVMSVLRAVRLPVQRTTWRLDGAGCRDEVLLPLSEDLGLPVRGRDNPPRTRTRDRFSWDEHLQNALLCLPFGHSFHEPLYRIDEAALTTGGAVARLRKIALRPSWTISKVNVAADGGLESIEQNAGGVFTKAGNQPKIPVSRLVAYVYEREGGNWLGTSLLRSAYGDWLLKGRALRVWSQTNARNGMGVPLYEDSPTGTAATLEAGLKMASGYRSGDQSGAAIQNGAKFRLMGVDGDLPEVEKEVRYHDEQIARAVLAHFLNLGTQTGSWALGSTFADFFVLSLQTLAQQLADVATMHIVEDWVDYNFGRDEPAPRIVFDEIGSQQAATAQALKLLYDAGLILPDRATEEWTRQQFGMPSKTSPPSEEGAA